jgi:hypothetical protein
MRCKPFVTPYKHFFMLSEDQSGVYDTGVVTSSGMGDGLYPLHIMRDKNGYIVWV